MLLQNIPRKFPCFSTTVSWMRVKSRQKRKYRSLVWITLFILCKVIAVISYLSGFCFMFCFLLIGNWFWECMTVWLKSVLRRSPGWKALTCGKLHGCNNAVKAGNVFRLVLFSSSQYLRFFCRLVPLISGLFPDLGDFVSFGKTQFSRSSSSS